MTKGRLRVMLGAAPGVGKTFAMLNEGRRAIDRGRDVVVGYVETHNRARTAEAIGDLEIVPRQSITYRGTMFEEMGFNYFGPIDGHDLDALVKTLGNLKDVEGPQFLHVVTRKGKGYAPAEADPVPLLAQADEDPDSGSRFTALRQFALEACTADCTSAGASWTRFYTSPADAFPSTLPRPVAPTLTMREFDVPDTDAAAVRLVTLENQCTGQEAYAGQQTASTTVPITAVHTTARCASCRRRGLLICVGLAR